MTRCDHGIRLDRWCADCEAGFRYVPDDDPAHPHLRLVALLALIAAVALVFTVRSIVR